MTEISIVIPTLNEEENIEKLLAILEKQKYPHDEVVIVDGHSSDRTIEICERYVWVKVYQMDRQGIGPARTYGASMAQKDIIAFLDCDGFPDPYWLARIRLAFINPEITAVAGLSLYDSESKLRTVGYNIFAGFIFYLAWFFYRTEKIPWLSVNNCAIRKEPFFKYKGFGPVQCEDLDFSLRAKGMMGVKYDRMMRAWLSDRRFRSDGFVKTVLLWIRSELSILDGAGIPATNYKPVNPDE